MNLQHQQGSSAVQSESPLDVTTRCVKEIIEIARTTGNKELVRNNHVLFSSSIPTFTKLPIAYAYIYTSRGPSHIANACLTQLLTFTQVESFVKIDTFTQDNEPQPVLALRYENIPETPGLFSKTKLTSSITRGRLGHPNKAKTFLGERSKACLIYLSSLSDDIIEDILKGTEFNE